MKKLIRVVKRKLELEAIEGEELSASRIRTAVTKSKLNRNKIKNDTVSVEEFTKWE